METHSPYKIKGMADTDNMKIIHRHQDICSKLFIMLVKLLMYISSAIKNMEHIYILAVNGKEEVH